MVETIQKIGLIAGNGKFPLLFARAARAKGIRVVALAVWGDTSFLIHLVADEVHWFTHRDLKNLFAFFRDHGVKKIIMAGQVSPGVLFDRKVMADDGVGQFFQALADRRCDTIFGAVAERLKAEGLELLDSTFLLQDHLAPKGTLTRHAPTEEQLADIAFGTHIAKQIGGLDIGQTVVVQDRAIVAIEALEGTDRCILRGGTIAREGAVVVKTSKPRQDSRFDIPVIGPRTIRNMTKVKALCLAIEAGRTLIIDRETTVRLADEAGIAIVAV